jgi:hypothetical protein
VQFYGSENLISLRESHRFEQNAVENIWSREAGINRKIKEKIVSRSSL